MATTSSTWKKIGIAVAVLIVLLTIAKSMGWLGGEEGLKVTTEQPQKRTIVETVSANGKVQPEVELKISADVSGEITGLFVKEGDVVKKGTLLCRINPEIYISSLDQSTAAVNSAKANLRNSRSRLLQAQSQYIKADAAYKRNKTLFDDKVISASDFEAIQSTWEVAKEEVEASKQSVAAAEFNVRSAEAGLKSSSENLNKTSIYAPVDGTISKLSKEKGERVVGTNMMEGTEILRIANLNEMEVSVDVSENDIVRVNRNDTTDIEIDAYLGRTFKGIVTEVANSANISTTVAVTDQVTNFTVKVRILRESYQDLLEGKPIDFSPFRPGMSASVDIRTKVVSDALSLPIQAVTTRDTTAAKQNSRRGGAPSAESEKQQSETKKESIQEVVFVVNKEGKSEMKAVKTGIQDSQHIEIVSGITGKDEIISGPYNAVSRELKNGTKVSVVSKEELFVKDK